MLNIKTLKYFNVTRISLTIKKILSHHFVNIPIGLSRKHKQPKKNLIDAHCKTLVRIFMDVCKDLLMRLPCVVYSGGSIALSRSNFLHLQQLSGKFGPIICWQPTPLGLPLPLGNPGAAPGVHRHNYCLSILGRLLGKTVVFL